MAGGLALLPFLLIIVPFVFVHSSASIYRSVYSEEAIRKAIEVIAEYRRLRREAEKSKRKMKKLRALEPEYKAARRTLLRSTMLKTLLLMTSYVAGSLLFMSILPGLASPYYIPGIVITGSSGACVIASIIVYFLAYVLFYAAYRDNFL